MRRADRIPPVGVEHPGQDPEAPIAGELDHVVGRGGVGAHHGESGLAHRREVALDLVALGELRAVGAGRERAVGDAAKIEASAADCKLLAVDGDFRGQLAFGRAAVEASRRYRDVTGWIWVVITV